MLGTLKAHRKVLLPKMMDELLQIVIDPFHPPAAEYETLAKE